MPDQGLTIFRNGVQIATAFQGVNLPTERLDDGVGAGFARVGYKGKEWSIRFQGETTPVEYTMPDGRRIPSPYFDCVILRASNHPSKAWYKGAYVDGQSGPPDCWSTDGFKPDAAAPDKQAPTCGGCPHNGWGSKINRETGLAMKGKACQDMKRLAVVPVGDIENLSLGGPMMLSVPPSSLKRLGPYQGALQANRVSYCQVWTRISFVQGMSYPVFDFDAVAGLTEEQAQQVVKMLSHPLINRILNTETQQIEAWDESAQAVHRQIQPSAPSPAMPSNVTTLRAPFGQARPVTSSEPVPHGSAHNDGMDIPDHLKRPPASQVPAPAPAEPAKAPPAGLPDQPPPGVDPAQWTKFLAMQRGEPEAPAKRRGRPPAQNGARNPPVSPQPTDSAAVVAAQIGQPQPQSTSPNEVLSRLTKTIDDMV